MYQKILFSIKKYDAYILMTLTTLTFIGALMRFYNLDWGIPFLHPDEHNIGIAVNKLRFPQQLNPDFFAYGSLPMYLIYFLGVLQKWLQQLPDIWNVTGDRTLLVGRYVSAFFSTLTIPIFFKILKTLKFTPEFRLAGVTMLVFATGLIQYAHFTTFETFLTFFYCVIFLVAMYSYTHQNIKGYLFLGIFIGLAVGTKIISLYLLVLPFFLLLLENKDTVQEYPWFGERLFQRETWRLLLTTKLLVALVAVAVAFLASNPFAVLDYPNLKGWITNENNIATGAAPIFYTRGFIDTTPVLYQVQYVFPFVTGHFFTLISLFGLVSITIVCLKFSKPDDDPLRILMIIFGGYLLFHLSLYVKWTRYMIPAIPLMIVAVLFVCQELSKKRLSFFAYTLLAFLVIEITFRGASFFQIYRAADTRLAAAQWSREFIPNTAYILTEPADTSVLPLNPVFPGRISTFGLYDYDHENDLPEFAAKLERVDYYIIPSRRVYVTALRLDAQFPYTARFYETLFSGELGFVEVFQSKPNVCLLPSTAQNNWPVNALKLICPINADEAEETFSVFDHPTVRIFEKQKPKTIPEYQEILRPAKSL